MTQQIAQVGKSAPAFSSKAVVDGRIKGISHELAPEFTTNKPSEMSLAQHTDNGDWVLLLFIPMAWSFICPTEITAFNARLQEFETRGCTVLFMSTDSEQVLRAWSYTAREDGGLGGVHVPLISDRSHRITREYGVLVEEEGIAQRAMFIIDPAGVVRHFSCNDVDVGRSVDEARRLLDALIFTDEFGEGCQVDWKKGDAGLKYPIKNKQISTQGRPEIKRLTSWTSNWLSQRPKNGSVQAGMGPTTPNELQSPVNGDDLFRTALLHQAQASDAGSVIAPSVVSTRDSVQITNLDAMSNNWTAPVASTAV